MFESKTNLIAAIVSLGGVLAGVYGWTTDQIAGIIWCVIGLVAAGLIYAFNLGKNSASEKEKTDAYERKKTACEALRDQMKRERKNLENWRDDKSKVIGNKYAEDTPFQLLIDRLKPLEIDSQFGSLAGEARDECEYVLKTPKSERDVKRLIDVLADLRCKIDAWIGPAE